MNASITINKYNGMTLVEKLKIIKWHQAEVSYIANISEILSVSIFRAKWLLIGHYWYLYYRSRFK